MCTYIYLRIYYTYLCIELFVYIAWCKIFSHLNSSGQPSFLLIGGTGHLGIHPVSGEGFLVNASTGPFVV